MSHGLLPDHKHWDLRAQPTPVVHISERARKDLIRLAAESRDVETGGGLYAQSRGPGATITVDTAAAPGRSFKRHRDSIRFDPAELDDTPGLVGMWHSHPAGGLELSPADIDSFRSLRRSGHRPIHRFVAIVVAPQAATRHRRGGWNTPRLSAWIIGGTDQRRWVIGDAHPQRATLIIAGRAPAADHAGLRDCDKLAPNTRCGSGWLEATRSFRCIYGAEVTHIARGERVHEGHPITVAHPEHFRLAPKRPGDSIRTTTRTLSDATAVIA